MQTVVEQIKDRLPLPDVLSSYITLIPTGKGFKARCPFHNERTASFSISSERGLYYCFGCGAKGDIFTFVQSFEGVDFNGALKILADRAGVELRHTDRKADDAAPVYEFLEKTTLRYQNELKKNNEALLYLTGRGISPETISQFRLGYAPAEWRFVANSCKDEKETRIAERAGLIKLPEKGETGERSRYDRFRGRIMFPLTDSSGRIIGFSGRIFPETPEGPKYLNSPETEVFQKSRILYGFDKAKFHIKRLGFAILVEGQMDLLLSHQSGFRNTVATSGTAVSDQAAEDVQAQLLVLSRLAPHLFLAFDGDAAGEKALSRAALVALSLGMNPKVVVLPEGKDPAEYLLSEGAEAWKTRLIKSEHFIIHQANSIKQKKFSPHMLVQALREKVFPYLSRVVSPVEQQLYTEEIARILSLPTGEVSREHARFVASLPIDNTSYKEADRQEIPKETGMNARERFAAFLTRFPDATIEKLKEKLNALSIAEYSFGVVSLAEERTPIALALVERDYGMLGESERTFVAIELAQKARDEFFSEVQLKISTFLREAEEAGDEEGIQKLLQALAEVHRRRHEPVG